MASFVDGTGREWRVAITVGHLPRLKEAGLDLSDALKKPDWVEALFTDPARLVAGLYVLCGGDTPPDEFALLFDGPTLERAGDALAEAVADFFPRSRVGASLKRGWRTILDRAEAEMVTRVEAAASTFTASAGNSGASSASTPAG